MQKPKALFSKWRGLFSDTCWSLLALLIMNATSQLLVYPFFSRRMGSEQYGNVLYLLSLVNIMATSFGVSINNVRMRASVNGPTNDGDYNWIILATALLAIPFTFCVFWVGGVAMSPIEWVLFWLLICATVLRNYSDVAFRLMLDYRKYFLYYLSVSIGYLLGIGLFSITGYWILALLPGELAAFIFCIFFSNIYRDAPLKLTSQFRTRVHAVVLLLMAQLSVNVVLNSDRMLLKLTIGGTAVATYYLASLMGKMLSLLTTPLNSVIIGHLTRYKGVFSRKMLGWVLAALLFCVVIGSGVCTGASHIFARIFYPNDYLSAKPFFFLANTAQLLFFACSVLNTVLLCFAAEKYQVVVNSFFVGAFILCIPLSLQWGLKGFSYGMLFATGLRFLVSISIAFRVAAKGGGTKGS